MLLRYRYTANLHPQLGQPGQRTAHERDRGTFPRAIRSFRLSHSRWFCYLTSLASLETNREHLNKQMGNALRRQPTIRPHSSKSWRGDWWQPIHKLTGCRADSNGSASHPEQFHWWSESAC